MSTAVGASLLAHGLHYAMVLAGLWGLGALLLPHALTRLAPPSPPSYDEHDRRVAELRAAVAAGAPGIAVRTTAAPAAPSPRPPATAPLSVPLAIVATAAAAGIHAAVAPPHLRESAVAGTFFLVVSMLQLAWAYAAARPTVVLLRAGVALDLGLVALWLVSRTTGLPLGLTDGPHPVGAWDVTCVGWQLLAAAACVRTLRIGVPSTCPGWFEWHASTRAAVGAAATSLVLLTLMGGHS